MSSDADLSTYSSGEDENFENLEAALKDRYTDQETIRLDPARANLLYSGSQATTQEMNPSEWLQAYSFITSAFKEVALKLAESPRESKTTIIGGNVEAGQDINLDSPYKRTASPEAKTSYTESKLPQPSDGQSDAFWAKMEAPVDHWASLEDTHYWFDQVLPSTDTQLFVITLALFGEESQDDILRMFGELKNIFQPSQDSFDYGISIPYQIFHTDLPNLMKAAHADFKAIFVQDNIGKVRVTSIDFIDKRCRYSVLKMLCRFYPGYASQVINFLKSMVEDDSTYKLQLRLRATVTIGLLGKIEFKWIREMVLNPWSNSNIFNVPLRISISNIFSLILQAEDGEYTDNVFKLVYNWAANSNPRYQITAAICCAGLGILDLNRTLGTIGRLCSHLIKKFDQIHRLDNRLMDRLSMTIGIILQAQNENSILLLLERFSDWAIETNLNNEELHLGSLVVIFDRIFWGLFSRRHMSKTQDGVKIDLWNVALHYRGEDETDYQRRHNRALYRLFWAGLNTIELKDQLRQILRQLVLLAAGNEEYQPVIISLFVDLGWIDSGNDGVYERVRDWLDNWAEDPELYNKPYFSSIIGAIKSEWNY